MDSILNHYQSNVFDKLFVFKNISRHMQLHLMKVFACLTVTVLTAVVGSFVFDYFEVDDTTMLIGIISSLILIPVILFTSAKNTKKRFFALQLYALSNSAFISPLIQYVADIDPAILVTAMVCTATIFVCFSISALTSKRRSYIFLAGFVFSAMTSLTIISFANFFFIDSEYLRSFEIYAGFFLFCLYIPIDIQLILARNSNDVIADSLMLFVDLVGLFVRVLTILLRKENKKRNN